MAKQMDADAIAQAVRQIEENTRRQVIRDIIATLTWEGWERGDDPDTWEAGFWAAIEVIKSNY